jgi:hypothetical protein
VPTPEKAVTDPDDPEEEIQMTKRNRARPSKKTVETDFEVIVSSC